MEVSLGEYSGNILESVCSSVLLAQDHSVQHFSALGLNAAIVGNNVYPMYVLYILSGKKIS